MLYLKLSRNQGWGWSSVTVSSLAKKIVGVNNIVVLSFRSLDEDGIKKLSTGGKTGKKERKSEKSEELPSEMW